jgi:hypothetical protein
MLRVTCALLLATGSLSCGPRADSTTDGGGPGASSPVCSVPVGGVMLSAQAFSFTGDALTCSGNAGGVESMCPGTPTVTQVTCADGFGFSIASGNETILLRVQGGEAWSAGAQLVQPSLTLSGNLTVSTIGPPDPPTPPAGTMNASFYVNDVMGSNFIASGELTTNWP